MHRALPLTLTPTLTLTLTLTRCIALYRWSSQPGKKAQDMRIGMDKGHNDDTKIQIKHNVKSGIFQQNSKCTTQNTWEQQVKHQHTWEQQFGGTHPGPKARRIKRHSWGALSDPLVT